MPSALVNIVGAENYDGEVIYDGLEEVLAMNNAFVHIYGKSVTKSGRKMGHVTLLSKDMQELLYKANQVKHKLIVKSKS